MPTPSGSFGYRVDTEALFAAVEARREEKRLSWPALAEELRVARMTFYRIKEGREVTVDTLARICAWLKVPIAKFVVPQ